MGENGAPTGQSTVGENGTPTGWSSYRMEHSGTGWDGMELIAREAKGPKDSL